MDRGRLLREEAAAWDRLVAVMATIPPGRIDDPRPSPDGRSPKQTMLHVAAWLDRCAEVCDRIAAGAWDPSTVAGDARDLVDDVDVERSDRARAMTLHEVEVRLARARDRARAAFAALPDVTADAWVWFEESGPLHYAEHGDRLAAFRGAAGDGP